MGYHYKSPEELDEYLKKQSDEAKPRMSRGRLILIVDLLILFLIGGILYYLGLFGQRDVAGENTIRYRGLELSASLPAPAAGKKNPDLVFYLNVKNENEENVVFPGAALSGEQTNLPEKGTAGRTKQLDSFVVEFWSQGILLAQIETKTAPREIGSGETALYSLPVLRLRLQELVRKKAASSRIGKVRRLTPLIRMKLDTNILTLRFPENSLKL